MTTAQIVLHLEDMYRRMYEGQPAGSYDIAGAVAYWTSMHEWELTLELIEAEIKFNKFTLAQIPVL